MPKRRITLVFSYIRRTYFKARFSSTSYKSDYNATTHLRLLFSVITGQPLQEIPRMENQPETTLIELIRYNNWANAQVLAACQKLTADQLTAAAPGPMAASATPCSTSSAAEADYIGRMMADSPQPPFKWEDQPALADVSIYAGQVADALLDAAQRIAPTHLVHEEEDGKFIDYQARHLFMQAINHGIEHRTNITTILSSLGLPALEVDGWGYLFSHPERFELKEGSK